MWKFTILVLLILMSTHLIGQMITIDRNKEEKQEWFSDLGFGLFIDWSFDLQLGEITSNDVAYRSKDFLDRYFDELPKAFNPKQLDPDSWAKLAKLAEVKYVIIPSKNYSGFCMWDTETTDFSIINSGYGKDIFKEMIDAFREHDIAIGISFSPDDFHIMYKQGYSPSRTSPESESTRNSELWETNKNQLKELLSNYGAIDILFISEKSDWANPLVANYAWDLKPNLIITRGGMNSPENLIPREDIEAPWELFCSMENHWNYNINEKYKSTTKIIDQFIETRAKGGNYLLKVSPNVHGNIPIHQENILREIGHWTMANHELVFIRFP